MSAPSFDAILQVSSPDLILHGDFDQEIDPKPLDLPHLEILLDEDPPRLQNASTSPQPELQLPITLSPGNSTKIFAAPMTADQRKLDWDLLINWRSGNITGTTRFQLSATADLGFEILSPHDKPPRKETNIRRAASEHWAPHEPEPDKSISVAVHSASDRAVAEQYYVLRALLTWNIQVPIRNQTFCLGEIDGEGYYLIADSTNSISIPEPGPGSFWTYQLADFIGKAVEYETGLIAGVNFDSGPRLFTLSKAECERLHDDPHTWSVRDTGIPENVGPFRFPTEKRRQFDDIAQDGVDAFIFYLTQAPTILEIGRRVDDLNPDRGAVVECDIHSDGTWIWSESLAYYLREYRIGPSPEMCRHIVDNFETREALHEDQVKLAQTAFIEQQRLIEVISASFMWRVRVG